MTDEQLDALIGLIADLGREVHWMLDDCEESGPVGDSTFTVEGAAVDKVSEILDRIEALPFEATPDAILLPGAMLREALQQSIAARTDAAVAAAFEAAAERLEANRAHLNFQAMIALLKDEPLPEPVVKAVSELLDGIATAIRALTPADAKDELDRMISAAVEKSKENHQ